MKPTKTHGGSRPGSGRKKKEPTKTISVRVPASKYEELKAEIKYLVKANT